MNNRIINILVVLLFSSFIKAQDIINLGGSSNDFFEDEIIKSTSIDRKTIRVLTVGIGHFNNPYEKLKSSDKLKEFKNIPDEFLKYSYTYHPKPIQLNNTVKTDEIKNELNKLIQEVSESDVVVISILSHGENRDGEYYLICSNTKNEDFYNTTISGKDLRSYFEKMADKGAIVLVFLDTCHAAAIFSKNSYTPEGNGSIAYFASSNSNESAKQIYEETRFTQAVIDIFQNKNVYANYDGFITIGSIDGQLKNALKSSGINQTPSSMYYTNHSHFDNYPILKKIEMGDFGSIWDYPAVWNPFKCSPQQYGRELDLALVVSECASAVGLITCGILQEIYKNNIVASPTDPLQIIENNSYRNKGKNASYGCWTCAGILVGSYLTRTIHVYHSSKKKYERDYNITSLNIRPLISPDYSGLYLAINID